MSSWEDEKIEAKITWKICQRSYHRCVSENYDSSLLLSITSWLLRNNQTFSLYEFLLCYVHTDIHSSHFLSESCSVCIGYWPRGPGISAPEKPCFMPGSSLLELQKEVSASVWVPRSLANHYGKHTCPFISPQGLFCDWCLRLLSSMISFWCSDPYVEVEPKWALGNLPGPCGKAGVWPVPNGLVCKLDRIQRWEDVWIPPSASFQWTFPKARLAPEDDISLEPSLLAVFSVNLQGSLLQNQKSGIYLSS